MTSPIVYNTLLLRGIGCVNKKIQYERVPSSVCIIGLLLLILTAIFHLQDARLIEFRLTKVCICADLLFTQVKCIYMGMACRERELKLLN